MALAVNFVDFWPDFSPECLFFYTRLLDERIVRLEQDLDKCDVLFCSVFNSYSVWGQSSLNYPKAKRVLVSGKNFHHHKSLVVSNFDYGIVTNSDTPYYYLPYAAIEFDLPRQIKTCADKYTSSGGMGSIEKTDFCVFCVQNGDPSMKGCRLRDAFFKLLSEYKRVDSVGPHLNNMPNGWLAPRSGFSKLISKYKFMICFENSEGPGYFTEKAAQCIVAGTIPIYWGSSDAKDMLCEDACIIVDETNPGAAIDRIIAIDRDDVLLSRMLAAKPFKNEDVFSREKCFSQLKTYLQTVQPRTLGVSQATQNYWEKRLTTNPENMDESIKGRIVRKMLGNSSLGQDDVSKLLVLGHLSMGDMILAVGLVNHVSEYFDTVVVVAKKCYARATSLLYAENPNVHILPVDDYPSISPRLGASPQLLMSFQNAGFQLLMLGENSFQFNGWKSIFFNHFYDEVNLPRSVRKTEFHIWRDDSMEEEVLRILNPTKKPYVFVHDHLDGLVPGQVPRADIETDLQIIHPSRDFCGRGTPVPPQFPISLYAKVIEEASELYLLNSSFHALACHLPNLKASRRVVYLRKNHPPPHCDEKTFLEEWKTFWEPQQVWEMKQLL